MRTKDVVSKTTREQKTHFLQQLVRLLLSSAADFKARTKNGQDDNAVWSAKLIAVNLDAISIELAEALPPGFMLRRNSSTKLLEVISLRSKETA